jgi:hypothetical protein
MLMAITVSLDSGDINFNYQTTAPNGYNPPDQTGVFIADLLNASFVAGTFATSSRTFTNVGEGWNFRIGTAQMREDFIASPWQHDPSNPTELDVTVTVNIEGTTLTFRDTPFVQSNTFGGGTEATAPRAGQAPVTNIGATSDDDVDFELDFTPQTIEINGHRFTVDIENITFAKPDSYPEPNRPIETEAINLIMRLDAVPAGSPEPEPEPPQTGNPPLLPSGEIDWDALAARVLSFFEKTGSWGLLSEWLSPNPPDGGGDGAPTGEVDWDTLSVRVEQYFADTGQYGLLEDWLSPPPPAPDGGPMDYIL